MPFALARSSIERMRARISRFIVDGDGFPPEFARVVGQKRRCE
jgi:hypothetical protein